MRAIALLIFIFSSMHTAHLCPRDPDNIAFPKRISVDGIAAPENCEGLTYCAEKPEDYPQTLFNEIFRDAEILQQPSAEVTQPDVIDRSGADPTRDQCPSVVSHTKLYLAREDIYEKWRTVIQVEGKLKQQVRLETCKNENSGELPSCFEELAGKKRAVCHQNYMSAHVLTYNVKNETTETTRITLPSCCSCKLRE